MSGIPNTFDPLGSSLLPAGFKRVNYLESTGTQWIDTGVVPVDIIRWELTFCSLSDLYVASGCYSKIGSVTKRFEIRHGSSTGVFAYCATASEQEPWDSGFVMPTVVTGFIDVGQKQSGINEVVKDYIDLGIPNNYKIALFGRSSPFGMDAMKPMRIYDSKIKRNNKGNHFIPTLDPHGKPCLFDLVTRTPFYNQGTGEFLWG